MNARLVEVVDYDPQWINSFNIEQSILFQIIGDNAKQIEHIGSTSVVGLSAKSVIDILIEVTSLKKPDKNNQKFISLNYEVKGENGIKGRRYFQKGGNQRSHHIHTFEVGDDNLMHHRAFRDYLTAHPEVANEYSQIKRQAVSN